MSRISTTEAGRSTRSTLRGGEANDGTPWTVSALPGIGCDDIENRERSQWRYQAALPYQGGQPTRPSPLLVLADRLKKLVALGLLTREETCSGQRARYSLTEPAIQLVPVFARLAAGTSPPAHQPRAARSRRPARPSAPRGSASGWLVTERLRPANLDTAPANLDTATGTTTTTKRAELSDPPGTGDA